MIHIAITTTAPIVLLSNSSLGSHKKSRAHALLFCLWHLLAIYLQMYVLLIIPQL
jgi:hypothetical protein